MKVLNFGSMNYDYVYQVDHILTEGETSAAFSMERHLGGKGLNQSIALAKAGIPVMHAGLIGEDGQAILDLCKKYGVDTSYVRQISGKCGHTIIQVDSHAQNSILLYGGSNRMQTTAYMDEVLQSFQQGDYLLLQNEINHLDYLIDRAFDAGMKIILNPSPFDEALYQCDLTKIDCFILNEIEGEGMTKQKDKQEILDALRRQYPFAQIVLTLGEQGSCYQNQETRIFQTAYSVHAIDTTAAGDTFTGYFIAGLLEGRPPEQILDRCARAAAIAVSRKGAADSIPFRNEVDQG